MARPMLRLLSMRATTLGFFSLTLMAAACMATPVDPDLSCNNDPPQQIRKDLEISSWDDVQDLPRTCFNVSQNTVTVEGSYLEDLQVLHNLREVGRLVIKSNASLSTTAGLKNLRVLSELRVEDNPLLFELPGFTRTYALDRLSLVDNPHLAHLTGLRNLQVITGEFAIQGETNLGDLELAWGGPDDPSLLEAIGALKLLDTTHLTTSGLPLVKRIELGVLIEGNQDLQSLGEMAELSQIGGDFTIRDNPVLEHANAFTLKFQMVGETLTVSGNDALDDLYDLQWIYRVGGSLIVTYNPRLSKCRAETLDREIVEVGGNVDIGDNSPDYDPCY